MDEAFSWGLRIRVLIWEPFDTKGFYVQQHCTQLVYDTTYTITSAFLQVAVLMTDHSHQTSPAKIP